MKIPYGIADFQAIRREGYVYVDRTGYIPTFEALGKSLLFLRPRRFGKSLWMSTLAAYYDLRTAGDHDRLFGGLDISRQPTENSLAHSFFILKWNFSNLNPDPPSRGDNADIESRHERLSNELHTYLNGNIAGFVSDYHEHLPQPVEIDERDAFRSLSSLLNAVRKTPHRIYLLVDEYDNFANEIMTADEHSYAQLVHTDGPFKYLFKWVKSATEGQGIDRLFMAGVSPIVMSDVTSGLNTVRTVDQHPHLAELCGFTGSEVRELVNQVVNEAEHSSLVADDALEMMREWYNGYRFAKVEERIYNPTLVFYFLLRLYEYGDYPPQMLDINLASDEGKLDYLSETASGIEAVMRIVEGGDSLEIDRIENGFTLRAMLDRPSHDATFLGSYLYYFGMLTLGSETSRRTIILHVPNLVARTLYLDRVRQIIVPDGRNIDVAKSLTLGVMEGKSLEPFLEYAETTVLATFSNRDAQAADERIIKTIFICLFWNDINYVVLSEPELGRGYADLCLIRRPDARDTTLWDLLFEFKRLSLGEIEMTGEEASAASRDELIAKPAVREALDNAEQQIKRYQAVLAKRYGDELKLKSWAVVAIGFDRLVARLVEFSSP